MKNLFFALAMMLVGSFAFANDINPEKIEKVKADDEGICRIVYEFYDVYGNVAGTFVVQWESATANSKADCLKEAVLQPTVSN